jgi:hypothetical protein
MVRLASADHPADDFSTSSWWSPTSINEKVDGRCRQDVDIDAINDAIYIYTHLSLIYIDGI